MRYIVFIFAFIFAFEARADSVQLDLKALVDHPTCLKLNLYHEGRGEGRDGMLEIMKVTLARVMSPEFPDSICEVVWDRCQFSWTCDRRKDNAIDDFKGWNLANEIVNSWFDGTLSIQLDPKILYYHAATIAKPKWFIRANLKKVKTIGKHIFYKE